MDRKKSIQNICVAIFFKLVLFALSIASRRFLIQFIGNDVNGIYSLYSNIIGVLSLAELGIGAAISFSMYQPIVENDTNKVAAIYGLFKKAYRSIALIILLSGLLVAPFVPNLTRGYSADFSIYATFVLMVISVAISYLYSSKLSLINAYKNNYISTTITSSGQILLFLLQILVLFLFKSFPLFLVCRIIVEPIMLLVTTCYVNKHHSDVLNTEAELDHQTKQEIFKKTKAMFMHKIGGVLVNSTDSIIISYFISVTTLGLYSNYVAVISAMAGILVLFFSPLTSVIGHLLAKKDAKDEKNKYFYLMYFLNFALGCIFYLGYYAIADNVILLFFGEGLQIGRDVLFVVTLNYFIQFMRQTVLLFRDASGTFYNDRWKPLFEGILNLILSILFVKKIGIVGVIVATIITNLFICHIVEPRVLFKYGLEQSARKYYILNYTAIAMFIIGLFIFNTLRTTNKYIWSELFSNGAIAVGIAVVIISVLFLFALILNKIQRARRETDGKSSI